MGNRTLSSFVAESNAIEGIYRKPTEEELSASQRFLDLPRLTVEDVCVVQAVYAPGKPLRERAGMNVRVGNHFPPLGGMRVVGELGSIVSRVMDRGSDPWAMHVEFEDLHPFMDGNGRTGRILWAWNMLQRMQDPFRLSFLHQFYYQTLAHSGRRRAP